MSSAGWKTGSSGTWSNASDWTTGSVPGSTTDVTISVNGEYIVTVNAAAAANSLTLSNGGATLQVAAALTVGVFADLAGIVLINHNETLQATGGIQFGPFGNGRIDGPGTLTTSGTTAINEDITIGGGLNWINKGVINDADAITAGDANGGTATLTNLAGASINLTTTYDQISGTTFNAATDMDVPSLTLINQGVFAETGNGPDTVLASVTNTGTIETQAGSLDFTGPVNNSGILQAASGSILEFDGGGGFGGTLQGAGTIAFGGGIATLAATADFAAANLWVSGGEVLLPARRTSVSGLLYQTSGTIAIAAGGTLAASTTQFGPYGSAQLDGPGTLATSGTTAINEDITIGGGLNWINNGVINDADAITAGDADGGTATLTNLAGASINLTTTYDQISGTTFNAATDMDVPSLTLINQGIFAETGNGPDTVLASVTNTGTIETEAGSLDFTGPVNNSRILQAASGSILEFDGGGFGGTLQGAGTIAFGGGTATLAGTVDFAAANLWVSGGEVLLPAKLTSVPGLFYQTGGTIAIATGGTLAVSKTQFGPYGSGEIDGPGTLATSGTTTVNEDITIGGGLNWINKGVINDAEAIRAGDANGGTATLTNLTGASINLTTTYNQISGTTFNAATDMNMASLTLLNQGIFAETGNGPDTVLASVTNTGTIETEAGSLDFTGPVNNSGILQAASGSILEFDGGGGFGGTLQGAGTIAFGGGIATLAGTVDFAAANLWVAGGEVLLPAKLTSVSGLLYQTSGTIAIAAGGTLAASATQFGPYGSGEIDGLGTLATSGTTAVNEDITIGGGLNWVNKGIINDANAIYAGDANGGTATLTNLAGASLDLTTTYQQITGSTFNSGTDTDLPSLTLVNQGVFAETGNGPDTVFADVTNTGTIAVDAGYLNLTGTLTNLAGSSLNGGSYLVDPNGTLQLSESTSLVTDAANIILSGTGSDILIGINNPKTLEASLVSISAQGILQNLGGRSYSAGTRLANSGSIVLGGGVFAPATLANAGNVTGYGTLAALVQNSGKITASGGTLVLTHSVSGSGTLGLTSLSGLVLQSNVASGDVINFSGTGETLTLDQPGTMLGTISGIAIGDTIDIAGTSVTSTSLSGNRLLVTLAGGSVAAETLATAPVSERFGISSDGHGGSDLTLYREATATFNPASIQLGEHHVGAAVSAGLTLANTQINDGHSEKLDAAFAGFSTGLTGSGSVTLLAAGVTSANALSLGLSMNTAGSYSGDAIVTLSTDGTGVDGDSKLGIGTNTIAVSGAAYAYASPSLASTMINFGIVHAGASVSQYLVLSDAASNVAYTEALDAVFTGKSTNATDSGAIHLLKAGTGNGNSLSVGLLTTGNGAITGTATIGLTSDGTGLDTLGTTALASRIVTLTGTVDNYATAALEHVSGAGTLTASNATTYLLNLGTIAAGGGLVARIGVLNSAAGVADLLSGQFTTGTVNGFTNSGFGTFSALGAGQADISPFITLSGTNAGTFSEFITLSGTGSNASGYSGTLAKMTLEVTGDITGGTTAGATYSLTSAADTISAGAGNDTIIAHAGQLSAGDKINGGGGTNTLVLQGGGIFDMRAPATLTNVQIVDAQEGAGALTQTLYLDTGFTGTVIAAPGATGSSFIVYGNTDSAHITLGTGNDLVYLGAASEQVNGGGGNDIFYVTSGDIGATINGGAGANTLVANGGGSFAMGANITSISSVILNDQGTQASTLTANTIANLAITGGNGNDIITLGAATQSVTTGYGNTIIDATAAQAGALIVNNGSATLNIAGGGNATLNLGDAFLTVSLSAATNLMLSPMSFITALGSNGNDSITALATQQTLTGGAGADTLIGYSAFGDLFQDTMSGLNGDTIKNFGGNDLIDITNLARASANLTYSGTTTAGTLRVSQAGAVVSTITLAAGTNLSASLFHMSSDGHGGTYIG